MSKTMERALTGLASRLAGKSTKDLAGLDRSKDFPPGADNYQILDDCGRGVSATVHRALCKPLNEIVAIKKMNLESLNCDLEEIIHEAQTMKAYNHPSVLPLYCSFVSGQDLWMVMPFISGGSVLHIMKWGYPEGLDEVTIATIMRDVLKALEYVHKQGGIHRDIKAGNILLDKDGHVQLGDFGVAASMERTGSWGHNKQQRMTFVGTPCWMAPEVMEQTSGYDSSADIWSFGITLLEMAHGHAPFARFPPMKVLLMTLQNPPPTLDDKGKKHFSKAMREVVSKCLQKDPKMRPTATQLLEHKFFKQARDDEYLAKHLMANLPPLGERVQEIRQGKAATSAQENDANFMRSQDEYKKGISSWNFDVGALKAAAAAEDLEEEPSLPTITEQDETTEGTLSGMVAAQAAAFVAAQAGAAAVAAVAAEQLQQQGQADGAQQPQQPVVALEPGARPQSPSISVFASLQGQQQLLRDTPVGIMPVAVGPDGQANEQLSSATGQAAASASASQPTTVPPKAPSSNPGHESAPLSPGTVSPSGLSREGSVQGPLAALATTPTANKQKIKQQGRFQIYEPGSEPPPMSPAATVPAGLVTAPTLPSMVHILEPTISGLKGVQPPTPTIASESAAAAVPLTGRLLEDGGRRTDLATQDSYFMGDGEGGVAVEPKKKGRFLVVEQSAGISKVASQASLADPSTLAALSKSRSEAGRDAASAGAAASAVSASSLGKPPVGPSAASGSLGKDGSAVGGSGGGGSGSASNVAVAALLPRLLELLDHTSAHQQAVQKLVGALQDVERGKQPVLLNRAASTRSLFVDAGAARGGGGGTQQQGGGGGGSGGGTSEEEGGGGGQVDALKLRVQELEADNLRLKTRNQQLEGLLTSAQQQYHLYQQQQQQSGGGLEASGSQVYGGSPGISPREASGQSAARAEEPAPPAALQ